MSNIPSMMEQSQAIAKKAAALYENRDMRTLSPSEQDLVIMMRPYHMTTPPPDSHETGKAVHK